MGGVRQDRKGSCSRHGSVAGTAPDNTSAWYVGYTPKVATAVALFRIDPKSQQLEPLTGTTGTRAAEKTGSTYPAAIWTNYVTAAP